MLRFWRAVGVVAVIVAGPIACGSKNTPVPYEVKQSGSLEHAKQILKGYAEGGAMGSEEIEFPQLIEDVRKTDPNKADTLEKGLASLKSAPASRRPAVAKELLGKLEK